MPVEPYTAYEAYCDLSEDDNGIQQCDWDWQCGRFQSDADCEVELCVHMLKEHSLTRPLPRGYEYMQEELTKRLRSANESR
jgi:hypothetical protein